MPDPHPTTSSLIDLPAVAQRLGVNQRHIRRLVAERRIPFLKWGHLLRFDPTEVDAWLDDCRQAPHDCVGRRAGPRASSPVRCGHE